MSIGGSSVARARLLQVCGELHTLDPPDATGAGADQTSQPSPPPRTVQGVPMREKLLPGSSEQCTGAGEPPPICVGASAMADDPCRVPAPRRVALAEPHPTELEQQPQQSPISRERSEQFGVGKQSLVAALLAEFVAYIFFLRSPTRSSECGQERADA